MRSGKNEDEKIRVIRLLRTAFSDVALPFSPIGEEKGRALKLLNSAFEDRSNIGDNGSTRIQADDPELIEIHFDLSMMVPEDFQYVLPRLMCLLAREEPEGGIHFIDMVVEALNVPSRFIAEDCREAIENIDRHNSSNACRKWAEWFQESGSSILAPLKEQDFSLFTAPQIQAVLEWLRFAATWDDVRGTTYERDINFAIEYWEEALEKMSR